MSIKDFEIVVSRGMPRGKIFAISELQGGKHVIVADVVTKKISEVFIDLEGRIIKDYKVCST